MTQYKNIDIVPDETVNRIHLSQGDVGRTLIFYLFENALSWSVPASSTIKCQGTKPSGFGFSVSCTYSGNAVTCVTTDEMTDEYGQIEAELLITSSDESQVFGTSNFILDIEKNPHPDGTVDGDAENPVIANLNAVITQATYDWLDEHPEATTTVEDGSITEPKLASALALKTIKDYVTPEIFGAIGDGIADDTAALQAAISNGNNVLLLNKTYKITGTITLRSDLTIQGLSRRLSKIMFYGSADQELFVSSTNESVKYLRLSNFTIEDTRERNVYLIDIPNSYPIEISRCFISGFSNANTQNYKGVRLYATATSHSYLAKIIHNTFTRCQLTLNQRVTDAYIAFNELWGQYCECALYVNGGSNIMISNNQIVGGRVYGGIRIENAINASINSNYFDGSLAELDTKCGIYSESGLQRSCVVGNKFWTYRSYAIYAPNTFSTAINGNVFDDCDYFNNGVPDVFIENGYAVSYVSNAHRRSQYLDTSENIVKVRTADMKQPPIVLKNKQSYPGSVVVGNTTIFGHVYSAAVYENNVVAQVNGSSYFDNV